MTLPLLLSVAMVLLGLVQATRLELALADAAGGAAAVWVETHSPAAAGAVAIRVLQADGLSPQALQWHTTQQGTRWTVTVAYPLAVAGWPTPLLLRVRRTVVVP